MALLLKFAVDTLWSFARALAIRLSSVTTSFALSVKLRSHACLRRSRIWPATVLKFVAAASSLLSAPLLTAAFHWLTAAFSFELAVTHAVTKAALAGGVVEVLGVGLLLVLVLVLVLVEGLLLVLVVGAEVALDVALVEGAELLLVVVVEGEAAESPEPLEQAVKASAAIAAVAAIAGR